MTYRIGKSFAAVHFDLPEKGRIVFLPEGAELCVVGTSRVSGCFEVRCQDRLYSLFIEDLLGPWSTPVGPTLIRSNPIAPGLVKPTRILTVEEACA
jgi:hypothetical protein